MRFIHGGDEKAPRAVPAFDVLADIVRAEIAGLGRHHRPQRPFDGLFVRTFETERLADFRPHPVDPDREIRRRRTAAGEKQFAASVRAGHFRVRDDFNIRIETDIAQGVEQLAARDREQAVTARDRRGVDDRTVIVALLEMRATERVRGGLFERTERFEYA